MVINSNALGSPCPAVGRTGRDAPHWRQFKRSIPFMKFGRPPLSCDIRTYGFGGAYSTRGTSSNFSAHCSSTKSVVAGSARKTTRADHGLA